MLPPGHTCPLASRRASFFRAEIDWCVYQIRLFNGAIGNVLPSVFHQQRFQVLDLLCEGAENQVRVGIISVIDSALPSRYLHSFLELPFGGTVRPTPSARRSHEGQIFTGKQRSMDFSRL
jgi:hypothetical protein